MKKIYLILFLYGITLLFGCTDDEPICINTSAAFKIEQVSVFYPGQEMECNICLAQDLVFTVLDSTITTVKWTIGNDPRTFEGQSVQLDFRGNEGHTFTVTCMVERDLTTSDICIGDNGIDTFLQSVQLIASKDSPIFGKYEGYIESNPSDIFTIELFYKDSITAHPQPSCGSDVIFRRLKGLPKTCNNLDPKCWYPYLNHTDKEFYFQSGGFTDACGNISGWGQIKEDKSIVIEFETGRLSSRITDKFIGNRIE